MDYELSKSQKLLQESVATFCQRESPAEHVRQVMESDTGHDPQLWQSIAEQGWIGLHLPEKFEGLGLSLVDLAVVAEQLGKACLPGPFLSATWAATLLSEAGENSSAARHLPGLIDGSRLATVALLESESSWDVRPERLQTRLDQRHVLTGHKQLVPQAGIADAIVCVASRGDELCLIVTAPDENGVDVQPTPGIDPTRRLYSVAWEGLEIQPESVIATGDAARHALKRSLQVATVAVCAELVGIAQWMLETTVEYAKTRNQFDRPIGSFQAVQHQCADMLLLTESARSAAYYAAWSLNEGDPRAEQAVSIAKSYCCDSVREVGNHAVQVHGGIGFTWEHDLHLYYKRSKADEYLFGDASFHRERIAQLTVDQMLYES